MTEYVVTRWRASALRPHFAPARLLRLRRDAALHRRSRVPQVPSSRAPAQLRRVQARRFLHPAALPSPGASSRKRLLLTPPPTPLVHVLFFLQHLDRHVVGRVHLRRAPGPKSAVPWEGLHPPAEAHRRGAAVETSVKFPLAARSCSASSAVQRLRSVRRSACMAGAGVAERVGPCLHQQPEGPGVAAGAGAVPKGALCLPPPPPAATHPARMSLSAVKGHEHRIAHPLFPRRYFRYRTKIRFPGRTFTQRRPRWPWTFWTRCSCSTRTSARHGMRSTHFNRTD